MCDYLGAPGLQGINMQSEPETCFPTLTSTSGSEGNQLTLLHSSISEMLFPTLCQIFISHGREALDPYDSPVLAEPHDLDLRDQSTYRPKCHGLPPFLLKNTLSISRTLCQFVNFQNTKMAVQEDLSPYICFWRRELADHRSGLWPISTIFITDL